MEELTVCKFGGTSLANSENIKRVCDIIHSDPKRRIIVVSAPGKRDKADTKLTDLLFEIYNLKENNKRVDPPYNEFAQRFLDIEREFKLETDLAEILTEFYHELSTKNCDFITSTGEYFMAKIMASILNIDYQKNEVIKPATTPTEFRRKFEFCDLDKTHAICFDENGEVDLEKSRANFSVWRDKCVVIPGFYGIQPDSTIKTFPRGGSDITGAIIANIADADTYENWTDVDGIYDKDPAKFPNAKRFDTLTYDEVEELARNGAQVLHPDCINFVRAKNIPIHLKNTFNPNGKGTVIQ